MAIQRRRDADDDSVRSLQFARDGWQITPKVNTQRKEIGQNHDLLRSALHQLVDSFTQKR